MNWLYKFLMKDARRRFQPNDRVRYFTESRKGKGSVVLTPSFSKGVVMNYDSNSKRYKVKSDDGLIDVHPRNIVPDFVRRSEPSPTPQPAPLRVQPPSPMPMPSVQAPAPMPIAASKKGV